MATLEEVRERLREARSIAIVTGAGVSAASGVPTFRGPGGLWREYRPEDLATPDAFRRDPLLVWQWYDWRRSLIARCEPNAAHDVIARWTARGNATLVTQNVDGLHERAGTRGVIRYHGSIWRLRCTGIDPQPVKGSPTGHCGEWEDIQTPLPELPPRCPACGALVRPGVVWFGEPIDPEIAAKADAAARSCDVFLSVGTSSVVYPAAGLVHAARAHGAYTVEINPDRTEAADIVDAVIEMRAELALPRLIW